MFFPTLSRRPLDYVASGRDGAFHDDQSTICCRGHVTGTCRSHSDKIIRTITKPTVTDGQTILQARSDDNVD